MIEDKRGLGLTTTSEDTAKAFDETLERYLEYRLSIGQSVKAMLAADPDFVMGHALVGYLMMAKATPDGVEAAKISLGKAEPGVGQTSLREQRHVAALRAWVTGELDRAVRIWEEIAADHPLDLLALRLAHFQSFWLGRQQAMRNVVARSVAMWDETTPRYGDVLGMLAFGHEETGDYPRAEALGRKAVDLNGEDLWSIHAVAHVLEMQGRHGDGLGWLDFPKDRWADRAAMRTHIWWHKSLFHFERGEADAVLQLYDEVVDPGDDFYYIDMQNCASLLARLELTGHSVGDRWSYLAERAASWTDNRQMTFTDAHTIIPLARTGRPEARDHLEALTAFARQPGHALAERVGDLVLPVCQAIEAFYREDFDRTVDLLWPIKDQLTPIGGSHAQRDVFELFLLEAALRSGRFGQARAIASERIVLREHSHGSWLKYAEALSGLEDEAGARQARERAELVRH
ncbi:MAG: tetratricopeptide repeat protein [Geminicoccaceae bacterium]